MLGIVLVAWVSVVVVGAGQVGPFPSHTFQTIEWQEARDDLQWFDPRRPACITPGFPGVFEMTVRMHLSPSNGPAQGHFIVEVRDGLVKPTRENLIASYKQIAPPQEASAVIMVTQALVKANQCLMVRVMHTDKNQEFFVFPGSFQIRVPGLPPPVPLDRKR